MIYVSRFKIHVHDKHLCSSTEEDAELFKFVTIATTRFFMFVSDYPYHYVWLY